MRTKPLSDVVGVELLDFDVTEVATSGTLVDRSFDI